MAKTPPAYPFVPSSNRWLVAGQFWGIPLRDGRFACGRVLQVDPESRVGVLVGLMDWLGRTPPTASDLSGSHLLDIGMANVKTIRETGRRVEGLRPLEADALDVPLRSDAAGNLVCGYRFVRKGKPEELALVPVLATWGFDVIRVLAEDRAGNVPDG